MEETNTKIDFLTKKIISQISEKELISIDDMLNICQNEEYLPNNQTDAYHYLNKLIRLGVILKVKNGLYEVDQAKIGAILNESR